MNMEGRQLDCLEGTLKPLGHLIRTTLEKTSIYDFFDHLCNYLVPFIETSGELENLRSEWKVQERNHKHRLKALEKEAIKEVSTGFEKLRDLITASKSLSKNKQLQKTLKGLLAEIESILELRDLYIAPPFYEIASDKLCELCGLLIDEGYEDLLGEYVDVDYIESNELKDEKVTKVRKAVLGSCDFTKAVTLRNKELSLLQWKNTSTPWVIWKYLCLSAKCWQLDCSYFEHRKPTTKMTWCGIEGDAIGLHAYWIEMQAIKSWNQHPEIHFFKIERFRKYLIMLTATLILYQERYRHDEESSSDELPCLHALELKLNANLLLLNVEWYEGGEVTSFVLRQFNEEAGPHLFFRMLLERPGIPVKLSEAGISSSSVSKLMTRANIKNPLKQLFFRSCKTREIILSSNCILISKQSRNPLEIKRYIESLNLKVMENAYVDSY